MKFPREYKKPIVENILTKSMTAWGIVCNDEGDSADEVCSGSGMSAQGAGCITKGYSAVLVCITGNTTT